MNSGAGKKSNTAVIVAAVIGGILVLLMVIALLGIYGVRRYLTSAKSAEGKSVVMELATGIARCGTASGLPQSTRPVPAALADASGMKYHSTPSDWSDPTFRCAGFAHTTPQYFQYQWQRLDDSHGVARARADFNRDGVAETGFDVAVTCAGNACAAAATVTDVSTGDAALPGSVPSGPKGEQQAPGWLIGVTIVGMLAIVAANIWLIVIAFSDSVLWGFLVLCVPCASLVFTIKNWGAAQKPFLLQVGSFAVIFIASAAVYEKPRGAAAAGSALAPAPASDSASAPTPVPSPTLLPTPVELSPAPALDGKSAPPTDVFAEAQTRALKWDASVGLVGIEVSGVVDGKVETAEGGFVALSYRRVVTSRLNADQLVVSYDKAGFREQESRSAAPLPMLPSSMCAPERIAEVAAGLQKTPGRLNLKYFRDVKRERLVWVASVAGSKEAPRTFDAQSCAILVR